MSKFPDFLLGFALAAALTGAAAAQDAAGTPAAAADVVNLTEANADEVEKATDAAAETATGRADAAADAPPADSAADAAPGAGKVLALGRVALPEEVAAWDIDVRPDGLGLPEGQGSVEDGEELFSDSCASCHGEFGEGVGRWPTLAGGIGTLADEDPEKTIGSYWPYLSTVWDYVHHSMPFGNAQILTPDDTYAITAYLLYSNALVEDDFVLSKENFLDVKMPNAGGFIEDDLAKTEYPKFSVEPCMENCKEKVEITMHASNLDVTPGGTEDAPTEGKAVD